MKNVEYVISRAVNGVKEYWSGVRFYPYYRYEGYNKHFAWQCKAEDIGIAQTVAKKLSSWAGNVVVELSPFELIYKYD